MASDVNAGAELFGGSGLDDQTSGRGEADRGRDDGLTGSRIEVVTRDEIPAIHTVIEGGREHVLGILKEFKRHERLSGFLPRDFRVAMAWVHLDAGQTLEPHVHPVDSMILICRGHVRALGDREAELKEGDILLVPHGRKHGFTGSGADGFWGISVQFDSRGLYEDLTDPWASFLNDEAREAPGTLRSAAEDPLDRLLAANDRYLTNFSKHRLFTMAQSGYLEDAGVRARFLDCFQVWSSHFQRMLQGRAFLSVDPSFHQLAQSHLDEELGHDQLLKRHRPDCRPVWDPVLEAACAWFPSQMSCLGELEKVVLVHLVVEASASVFYREMAPVMAGATSRAHFEAHADAEDQRHFEMGVALLRQHVRYLDLRSLMAVQKRGWDMLSTVFGRIAELMMTAA